LVDRARNRGNLIDRFSGGVLDAGDLLRDLIGRARSLIGESLYFGSDHREPLAGFSGTPRMPRPDPESRNARRACIWIPGSRFQRAPE
jgi:hypothetical protein